MNYGQWQSDLASLVTFCQGKPEASCNIARMLAPQADDITVLKPRHSASLSSPLDLMLQTMGVREIILEGLATDICVRGRATSRALTLECLCRTARALSRRAVPARLALFIPFHQRRD